MVLLVVILAFTPLFAVKKTRGEGSFPVKSKDYGRVITVWNIDTFEGGVGSRGDFLNSCAVEMGSDELLAVVSSHTPESATAAIEKGVVPSVISFGQGLDFIAAVVKKTTKRGFVGGGECGGEIFAYPWCAGGYFLIRKSGDLSPIGKLTVSDGERNVALGALYFSNIDFDEFELKSPLDAYVDFVGGKTDALLGTQRDIRRLIARGFSYEASPIETFCDLFQYVAITATKKDEYDAAKKFVDYITGEKVQSRLSEIGMLSVSSAKAEVNSLDGYDRIKNTFTISAFSSCGAIEELKRDLKESVKARKKSQTFENALKDPRNA